MLKLFIFIPMILASSSALLRPPENFHSNLPKFVCDVSEEVSQEEIQTMALVKLQNNFSSEFFDELQKCLTKDIAMVQVNIENMAMNDKLKDAKFAVVVGDEIDASLMLKLTNDQSSIPVISHMANFLFVSSSRNPKIEKLSKVFAKNGILNFAFAYEDEEGEVCVEVSNHFANNSQTLKGNAKLSELFPDKLANMHKTPIRAVANSIMPNVKVQNGKVTSSYLSLFQTIAENLNATFETKILDTKTLQDTLIEGKVMFENREVDFTLGSKQDTTRYLVSYTEFGFCALIPQNSAQGMPKIFSNQGFNLPVMLIVLLITACIMLLWKGFKVLGQARGSSWRILFGLIATSLGQSFKIRTTNFMMYSVIVLNIYATIIYNNLYQAIITSEITKPTTTHKMQTFADLFDSDNEFVVGISIVEALESIPQYQKAFEEERITIRLIRSIENLDKVTITRCDIIEEFLASAPNKSFYILPEKAYSYVTLHEMGFTSPYTVKFQDLVNRIFSAGLHQAWDTFEGVKKFEFKKEEESAMLTFENMRGFLLIIMPCAFALQILVFLMEIFYARVGRAIRERRNRVHPLRS